ncbi:MAG: hypothetical protein JSW00_09310 [Thermoplasmata archaeon]|nr:MAG: hypothetical protein JSW00_09310 [Thermoplasmata archaeon]
MLLELVVAALIGISFGNAWACILMSFGTSAEERSVGKWFIAGRFLGLILLGSVISLLRFAAQDVMPIVILIFGVSTLLFGLLILIRHLIQSRYYLEDKKGISDNVLLSLISFFMVIPKDRKCKGNPNGPHGHKNKGSHHRKQGQCKRHKNFTEKSGFALGVLRGATPCAKVIVLTPLLVAFGFPGSLPIILVYASASTIYPVIGYLSADVLSKFDKYQLHFKILGAFILIAMGLYFIVKVVMWNSTHIGM